MKMLDCKPCSTHVPSGRKLYVHGGIMLEDPTQYCQLVGALQYLTFTRPDITYIVQQVCQFMHCPGDIHLQAANRILPYLKGTLGFGLQFTAATSLSLTDFVDADWVIAALIHVAPLWAIMSF